MERRYVPLRPSTIRGGGSSSGGGGGDDTPSPSRLPQDRPDVKRRRIGVSVACNACRRKKIRCDGIRPTCSQCTGQATRCEYRDEGGLTPESKDLVVEIFGIINQLPTTDAIQVLSETSKEEDALAIISIIRERLKAPVTIPGPGTEPTAESTDQTRQGSFELEMQNPIAYPSLSKGETDLIGEDAYRRLVRPSTQGDSRSSHGSNKSSQASRPSNDAATPARPTEDFVSPLSPLSPLRSSKVKKIPPLCDSRLRQLDIARWTDVNIDNDLAARCISLYLEIDHPLLGHFDEELLLSHLIDGEDSAYCSSLLVNSLLYWACQMYSAIDPRTDKLAAEFCAEAERRWDDERSRGIDSLPNLAAAEFLSLGYLGQGRDHSVLKYMTEACEMGNRMSLFGGEEYTIAEQEILTNDASSARILMSLFYYQPGIQFPSNPPSLPIPQRTLSGQTTANPSLLRYMGLTFPSLCRFWAIVHEVSLVYHGEGKHPWGSRGSLAFAEFKFRELLAWSNSLPFSLSSEQSRPPQHVQVMHLWFHAAILDIFRPFVYSDEHKNRRLRTFSSRTITPEMAYTSSSTRLKRLIVNYRLNYASSSFTILWHTALIYAANAILEHTEDKGWYSYLLLCLYGYRDLSRSWRVAKAISKGLLSMALRQGDLSGATARRLFRDLDTRNPDEVSENIRATFMLDLELAPNEPELATVERLAADFEGNAMMMDYTTIMEEN